MKKELLEEMVKNLNLGSEQYVNRHPAKSVAQDIAADPCSKYYDVCKKIDLQTILINIEKLKPRKEEVMKLVISKIGKEHKLTKLVSLLFDDV